MLHVFEGESKSGTGSVALGLSTPGAALASGCSRRSAAQNLIPRVRGSNVVVFWLRPILFLGTTIWVVVKIMVPLLGPLDTRCRIILRTQKGTILLTTTHILPRKELHLSHWLPRPLIVSLAASSDSDFELFQAAVHLKTSLGV